MNAAELIEYAANKEVVEVKEKLSVKFKVVLENRLDEIERLKLKTECAMQLNDSKFWMRRLQNNWRDLEENRLLATEILWRLDNKKERILA